MFNPGDEVICVDDSSYPAWKGAIFTSWLVKGQKYTIRAFFPPTSYSGGNVLVQEIRANIAPDGLEYAMKVGRFRKVQKTDISVFEKFKQPISVSENANA